MSFRLRTIIGIASIQVVLLTFMIWNVLDLFHTSIENEIVLRAESIATLFSTTTKDAVLSNDLATLESFVQDILNHPGIVYVRVSNNKHVLAEGGDIWRTEESPGNQGQNVKSSSHDIYHVSSAISVSDEAFGKVQLGLSIKKLTEILNHVQKRTVSIAILVVLLCALFSIFLGTYLVRQLEELRKASKKLSAGELGIQIPVIGKDEIASTAEAFNIMSQKLNESLGIFEKTNIELKEEVVKRVQAEHELSKNLKTWQTTFDAIHDAVFISDRNHTIIQANEAARQLLDMKTCCGSSCYMAVHGEKIPRVNCSATTVFDDGKSTRFEIQEPNLGNRWFEVSVYPILDSRGTVEKIIHILVDISDRRKAGEEKQQMEEHLRHAQKMEAIGTLAAGIAHDFNNILSPIYAYIELVQLKIKDNPEINKYLDEVLGAAYRAGDLVKQILAFSRKRQEEFSPVDIQSILKETLKMLRSSLPSTIDIQQQINPGCGLVMGHATQIHQVMMNLGTNAYHSMRERGGTLRVELKPVVIAEKSSASSIDLAPGSYIRLEVGDEGTGMRSEIVSKIFEPYFTTKPQGEGTGIGLSVVLGIVKSHGGDITVSSKLGAGSTFKAYFPVIDETELIENKSPTGLIAGNGERILVVDDEEKLANMDKVILEDLGYRVTIFISPVQALEHFREKPESYDLVLTDMTMPKMTGDKLAREIVALRPDMPVILYTGFKVLMDEEEAIKNGIRRYITKPYKINDFARIIREVLEE